MLRSFHDEVGAVAVAVDEVGDEARSSRRGPSIGRDSGLSRGRARASGRPTSMPKPRRTEGRLPAWPKLSGR